MRALLRHASRLGVTVHAAHLAPGVLGEYYADEHEIFFDLRLTPTEQRATLAHELGHVHHDHRACDDDPRAERQANIYAARILIDPHEYARLERIDPDQHHLADELGVPVDVILTFEAHCLTRLRGVTYIRPRHGTRQWLHRSVVA